jgi:hypothetical protein
MTINAVRKLIREKQEFKSKAGAGEDGSNELVKKYMQDTPGQRIEQFKNWTKKTE